MNGHITLSLIALLVAVASVVYSIRVKRNIKIPLAMPAGERICMAWNDAYPVGVSVAYESEPIDPGIGKVAVRTLSPAYVKDKVAVVDVERFGTIELDRRMHAIR